MIFLWCKVIHIIGVISWMAGLLYLPRLFVYHAASDDPNVRAQFCIMEEKLYRIIMRTAMVVTLVFGGAMMVLNWSVFYSQPWLWLKLALVVGLLAYHDYCGKLIQAFATGTTPHSERFFRIFNEAPVLALIPIVILVVIKPF